VGRQLKSTRFSISQQSPPELFLSFRYGKPLSQNRWIDRLVSIPAEASRDQQHSSAVSSQQSVSSAVRSLIHDDAGRSAPGPRQRGPTLATGSGGPGRGGTGIMTGGTGYPQVHGCTQDLRERKARENVAHRSLVYHLRVISIQTEILT
jgi:hypothetical protein